MRPADLCDTITFQLLAGELYQVAPRDPRAILGVAAVMLGTAPCACWLPARRGAATDPIAALRAE